MIEKLSLAIGDQVEITETCRRSLRQPNHKGMSIITDVSISTGRLAYAVNGCAWYSSSDVVCIAEATEESIELAFKLSQDEEDEDLENADDEDECDADFLQHTPDPADDPDEDDEDGFPAVKKEY